MNPPTTLKHKAVLIFFGCLLCVIALEIGMNVSAGLISVCQTYRNRQTLPPDGAYRILCLGESTTFFGAYNYAYPAILERMLNNAGLDRKFRVFNEGRIGTDSTAILADVTEHLQRYQPDMVISMMGINDTDDEAVVPSSGLAAFMGQFKVVRLLKHIGTHARSRLRHRYPDRRIDRAYRLIDEGEYADAEEDLSKMLRDGIAPAAVYAALGKIYWLAEADFDRSVAAYEKALTLEPLNETVHEDLFIVLYYAQMYPQAAAAAERMLKLFPGSVQAIENLAKVYLQTKDYAKLNHVLQRAEARLPSAPAISRLWAAYYLSLQDPEQAETYFRKFARLERERLNPVTVNNYRRLRSILHKKGIQLVSVQYPVRDVATLQAILDRDPQVIYVSNERNFKEAILRDGYRHYFTDHFAGDFGHLTEPGNQLLAESIAAAVVANDRNP